MQNLVKQSLFKKSLMKIIKAKLVCATAIYLLAWGTLAHAKDASHAEKGAKFPPFDTTTFAPTLFWLFVTFVTLYWIMSRVALPRVSGIIDNRNAIISRDVDQASALQKKAEEAGAAYEAALTKAKANALSIGTDAKNEAAKQAVASRQQVEADMAVKIAAAEASIVAKKTAAMGNVSAIAEDAVSAIIQRLTGTAPDTAMIRKAISANSAAH